MPSPSANLLPLGDDSTPLRNERWFSTSKTNPRKRSSDTGIHGVLGRSYAHPPPRAMSSTSITAAAQWGRVAPRGGLSATSSRRRPRLRLRGRASSVRAARELAVQLPRAVPLRSLACSRHCIAHEGETMKRSIGGRNVPSKANIVAPSSLHARPAGAKQQPIKVTRHTAPRRPYTHRQAP
jgi:hypothetical protein